MGSASLQFIGQLPNDQNPRGPKGAPTIAKNGLLNTKKTNRCTRQRFVQHFVDSWFAPSCGRIENLSIAEVDLRNLIGRLNATNGVGRLNHTVAREITPDRGRLAGPHVPHLAGNALILTGGYGAIE